MHAQSSPSHECVKQLNAERYAVKKAPKFKSAKATKNNQQWDDDTNDAVLEMKKITKQQRLQALKEQALQAQLLAKEKNRLRRKLQDNTKKDLKEIVESDDDSGKENWQSQLEDYLSAAPIEFPANTITDENSIDNSNDSIEVIAEGDRYSNSDENSVDSELVEMTRDVKRDGFDVVDDSGDVIPVKDDVISKNRKCKDDENVNDNDIEIVDWKQELEPKPSLADYVVDKKSKRKEKTDWVFV